MLLVDKLNEWVALCTTKKRLNGSNIAMPIWEKIEKSSVVGFFKAFTSLKTQTTRIIYKTTVRISKQTNKKTVCQVVRSNSEAYKSDSEEEEKLQR